METKTLRCTYCGARLNAATEDKATCPYCGSVNYIRFAEKTGKDSGAQAKLGNLRERLKECVNARYHDFEEMKEIADEILDINGYDFEAKYFYALALKKNNKRNKYIEFLTDEKNLAPNAASLELVMRNVIRYAKENERSVIRRFVEINVADSLARLEYMDEADRQIERASKNFHGGQDVFVCHKSKDGMIAETVVNRLESEGITCFISERNLEDLEIGEKFERALVKAISSTKLFLLISSYAAFDNDSENYVLFEMEEARKLKKPNAEFRIDNIDSATEKSAGCYREYFDGCQYIDAYPSASDMLDKLAAGIRLKLDKIDGGQRTPDAQREARTAEMAAEIERLKAEKLLYQRKLEQLSRGEEKIAENTDTERSEKDEIDAVFGYSSARVQIGRVGDGGEKYYAEALDYDFGRGGKPKDKAKAVYYYTKAAEAGHELAMLNLGVCYEYGDGIAKNPQKAVSLYVAASEKGNAMAQCNLGYCYFNGVGVGKDAKKAALWYKKAADGKNVRAMNNLGYCYENGQGVARNPVKAYELYKNAADGGDVNGACNVAWCYESGIGTGIDYVKARMYNAMAKENGSSRAAKAYERIESRLCESSEEAEEYYEKGLRYDTGEKRNAGKAAACYKKAAKSGNVRALYNLGVLYLRGDGVSRNAEEAFGYFSQASQKHHLGALYNLGYCYEKGVGTQSDAVKARACYEKAALGGYGNAQYAYACFNEGGIGGKTDTAAAAKFYKRAAKNGVTGALVSLGLMYGDGRGVEKDRSKARRCFEEAAAKGDVTGLYNYGCILRDDGDMRGAADAFGKAAEKDFLPALYNLGVLAEDGGNSRRALEYYSEGAEKGDGACARAVDRLKNL